MWPRIVVSKRTISHHLLLAFARRKSISPQLGKKFLQVCLRAFKYNTAVDFCRGKERRNNKLMFSAESILVCLAGVSWCAICLISLYCTAEMPMDRSFLLRTMAQTTRKAGSPSRGTNVQSCTNLYCLVELEWDGRLFAAKNAVLGVRKQSL